MGKSFGVGRRLMEGAGSGRNGYGSGSVSEGNELTMTEILNAARAKEKSQFVKAEVAQEADASLMLQTKAASETNDSSFVLIEEIA